MPVVKPNTMKSLFYCCYLLPLLCQGNKEGFVTKNNRAVLKSALKSYEFNHRNEFDVAFIHKTTHQLQNYLLTKKNFSVPTYPHKLMAGMS